MNNNSSIFNIKGEMNKDGFNHDNIKLNVSLLLLNKSKENIKEIYCKVKKINEKNYSLDCLSNDEINACLDGAYSILEKEILFININRLEKGNTTFEPDFQSQLLF